MLTAYSGTKTCHTEPRLACWEMNAYRPTSTVITVIRAHQVSTLSHSRGRRTRGTVVARGSAKAVNVIRIMIRPPMSRFASVASMPNGPTGQPVAIPMAIMRAWVSRVIAR